MQAENEAMDEEFLDEPASAGGYGEAMDETDNSAATVKKLRERLKKTIEEKQEYLDGWQRARADFANYKREEAAGSERYEARLKIGLVEELLPILDSLELSITHASEKDREGLSGMRQQFLAVLKRLGVEPIEVHVGDDFDHTLHEALHEEGADSEELDHTIVKVHRGGYRLGDRVIRPAQVTIGRFEK